ncbi:MAG: hypothetical protein Q8O03_02525 [Nanoarchaeota archaeon]|nr:hypothetical protein [Nanoarchaeota archaeon]
MSKKIRKEEDPTKVCILCGSKNVKLVHEGLETDMYKCLDCGKKYGVTDWRRIAGFTKQEIEKMDKKK